MKRTWFIFIAFLIGNIGTLSAQDEDVLFRIGNKTILEEDVLQTLPKGEKEISMEIFNRVLNYYLSIYDFKQKKLDTTLNFRRDLEMYMQTFLNSAYTAHRKKKKVEKCKSTVILDDLFVPFDPTLLQKIKKMQEENKSFEEITDYAKNYTYSSLHTRVISEQETNVILNKFACELIQNKHKITPPIKSYKGYHYFKLAKEQTDTISSKTPVGKYTFFPEELKIYCNVTEFPHHFLSGKNEILFLIGTKAYYTEDLKKYSKAYKYELKNRTYDTFLYHLLIGEYVKKLPTKTYQNLLDDFYFMQVYNPVLLYKQKKNDTFVKNLRTLIKKYKPFIPKKKYVENNLVFETK